MTASDPRPGADEELLAGGVANAGAVARVGDHVVRPAGPQSAAVHEFLSAVRHAGFDGVPQPMGVGSDGRERLVFIPGDVAVPVYPLWVQSDDALASVAALLAGFHAAAARFDGTGRPWNVELADPVGGALVCHNDVCLENVVFRDGAAVALLDFDFAAPGRPVYDVGQFARMCVPIDDPKSAAQLGWLDADRARRLRLVADTYGLDRAGRGELLGVLDHLISTGGEFVRRRADAGDANFIAMWNRVGGQARFDRRRRWWAERRADMVAALA